MRCLAVAALIAMTAFPAHAQVAVEGTLQTDYRVRGYSVSDGNPAVSLALSYDDASGAYIGATAIASWHAGEPEASGFQANAGYAVRIAPQVSLDAGVSHSEYRYTYRNRRLGYSELYLGLSGPHLSARVNYSPDYGRADNSTLYAEVEGGIEPAADWLLSAHAGVFSYLGKYPAFLPRERYDWRIGAARKFGPTTVRLDLSGRVQGSPARQATDATALVLSLTHGF